MMPAHTENLARVERASITFSADTRNEGRASITFSADTRNGGS